MRLRAHPVSRAAEQRRLRGAAGGGERMQVGVHGVRILALVGVTRARGRFPVLRRSPDQLPEHRPGPPLRGREAVPGHVATGGRVLRQRQDAWHAAEIETLVLVVGVPSTLIDTAWSKPEVVDDEPMPRRLMACGWTNAVAAAPALRPRPSSASRRWLRRRVRQAFLGPAPAPDRSAAPPRLRHSAASSRVPWFPLHCRFALRAVFPGAGFLLFTSSTAALQYTGRSTAVNQ